MKLRYFVILAISLIGLLSGTLVQPALAQPTNEPTGYKNVTLWVYPEYDDPRLLVMLEGQIAGTTLPALVRFLVTQSANMFSAGSKNAQGVYSGGPPDRKASSISSWDEISFTMPASAATFRVEYYDDIITGSPDKKISYDFRWLYPISDLNVIIQQPLKATNFSVTPPGVKTTENNFNVVDYTKNNLTVDPNTQPLHFDVSYTKTDPNPSIQSSTTSGSGSSSSNTVALVLIAVALVIVAIFLVLFLVKRRPGPRAKLAPRFDAPRPSRPGRISGRDKFCTQCGHPAGSGRFCQNCGNKLD
jgi:hypothetical protein